MFELLGISTQALFAQLLVGLINGSFYALLSLGLAVIFGMLNIINFSHGAQYMLGAFALTFCCRKSASAIGRRWSLAPIVVGLSGIVIERLFLQWLYKLDHLYGLLLTFGLALIIEGVFRNYFGASGLPYQMPKSLTGGQNLGFMYLPNYRAWVVVLSLAVCLGTWFIIERTKLGSYLRAATENPTLVRAFGNEEASILVGQNIPTVSGSFTTNTSGSTNPFQTVQRQDIGVKLEVTPQINEGNAIKLKVKQEVSSVISNDPSTGPTLSKREIETSVMVDDGKILVLGGLIQDDVQETVEKVPIIGDIPYLGHLFQDRKSNLIKRNLMVFLRPVIMRDPDKASSFTEGKYNDLRYREQRSGKNGVFLMPNERTPILPALPPPVRSRDHKRVAKLPQKMNDIIAENTEVISRSIKLPSYSFAKRYSILVKDHSEEKATIVCLKKTPSQAILEIRRLVGKPVKFEQTSEADFDVLLHASYGQKAGHAQQMVNDLHENLDLADMAQHLPKPEDLLESADEAPIIRLINALLTEAIKENASDIHIESYESRMVVRFRVDGTLREIIEPQREFAPMVISRLKVMAKLDIAEKRLPQDGRISLNLGGRTVDVRVSTMPSGHGERVVLRLLDKQANQLSLRQIGMSVRELEVIQDMIARPHGIILVTGPTGSGKTTSLYAIVNQLNERSRNILTVEDPIEYYLDGIGQTQVNNKVEMTFAKGLRAILRQDPDVVMVGEIRDKETAEIAVQASLTGHLVLSTLHTNTAVGAITRLRDMGVEPFLLSSSLVGVLAQRLVRRLCPFCKQAQTVPVQELEKLGHETDSQERVTIYQAQGCSHCGQKGFKGRFGLFEIIPLDKKMRSLIHDCAGDQVLEKHARQFSRSIQHCALEKVLAGDTSLDEAIRITQKD